VCVEAASADPAIEEVEEFGELSFFGAVVGAVLGLASEGVEACAQWAPPLSMERSMEWLCRFRRTGLCFLVAVVVTTSPLAAYIRRRRTGELG